MSKRGIGRDERERLRLRHCDEQPVERIAMMIRQLRVSAGVTLFDGQRFAAVTGQSPAVPAATGWTIHLSPAKLVPWRDERFLRILYCSFGSVYVVAEFSGPTMSICASGNGPSPGT